MTPLAYRAVLFQTIDYSWHGFPRIHPPEGKRGISRKRIAGGYHTVKRPGDYTTAKHATCSYGFRMNRELQSPNRHQPCNRYFDSNAYIGLKGK